MLSVVGPEQFDDLNAGFVQELFAEYLASPEAVDDEWRALFEAAPAPLLEGHPLVERLRRLRPHLLGDGDGSARVEAAPPPKLLRGGAAAVSLLKGPRTPGHL